MEPWSENQQDEKQAKVSLDIIENDLISDQKDTTGDIVKTKDLRHLDFHAALWSAQIDVSGGGMAWPTAQSDRLQCTRGKCWQIHPGIPGQDW